MNILTYQALFEFQTNPSGFFKWEGAHKHTFVEYVPLRVHTVTLILILTINKTSTKPLPTQTNSASENLRKVSSDASLVRSSEGLSSCPSSPTLRFPNNVPSCQSRQVATIEYHSVAIEKSTQHCYWLELPIRKCAQHGTSRGTEHQSEKKWRRGTMMRVCRGDLDSGAWVSLPMVLYTRVLSCDMWGSLHSANVVQLTRHFQL